LKTIGRHLIAEFYGCAAQSLDCVETVRAAMLGAADAIGATTVGDTFHKFAPQGVSGTVVIAESHLSIHTWPENGYVALDIYTCGELDPHVGLQLVGRTLKATHCRTQEIVRGLAADIAHSKPLLPDDVQIMTQLADLVPITEADPPDHEAPKPSTHPGAL